MNFIECHYYTENPMYFHGCPGLDVNGDSDECGDCRYRLDSVCKALASQQPAPQPTQAKDRVEE